MPLPEVRIEELALEAPDVHVDLPQQRLQLGRPGFGRDYVGGAAGAHQRLAVDVELVALGVTAEVVVIVEQEDLRVGTGRLTEEPGRREPAEARAHHHEVVGGIDALFGMRPALALAEDRMGHLEGARVRAAQARARRRVVADRLGR